MSESVPGLTVQRIDIRGAERKDVRNGWRFQVHVFTEQGGQHLSWAGTSYERALLSAERLATELVRAVAVVDLLSAC